MIIPEKTNEKISGFLFIDKPIGPTSHDVVAIVRRLLPRGIKVGHAGTLDPLASGLLILGIGKATKSLSQIVGLDKQYETTIMLGATTETDDAEAEPRHRVGASVPTLEVVRATIRQFIGEQKQIPPAFSAKKIAGQRLYKLARQGKIVAPNPHSITIYDLEIIKYNYPELSLHVCCSSGTYIRALARDIGAALKIGGYVKELRRGAIGQFDVKEAIKLETIAADTIDGCVKYLYSDITKLF